MRTLAAILVTLGMFPALALSQPSARGQPEQVPSAPVLGRVVPQEAATVGGVTEAEADRARYLVRSLQAHRTGKFYFEVVIDQAATTEQVEAQVVARVNDGRSWAGTAYQIRPRDLVLQLAPDASVRVEGGNLGSVKLPKVVVGVALDLDARRFYRHRNGQWIGAAPGTAAGVPLKTSGYFHAEVSSSVSIERLRKLGVITVNFGSAPFQIPPPVGYRGFDSAEALGDATRRPAPDFYAPDETVAGETQLHWVRRYWEWVRSFATNESPSSDMSGFRCGAGQSGPVWFLTGSFVSETVRRECEVPAGKIILVPIVNVLAQAKPDSDARCDRLTKPLQQFGSMITGLRLQANGAALPNPTRYLRDTGCFDLRDASIGQASLAAGTGYWVFLKPLDKGRHEVSFGARFTMDNFQQDITYVLHVR